MSVCLCAGFTAQASASDVFYVGDSLGADTTPFVRLDLGGFTVRGDNRIGRGSGEGVSVLRSGLRRDDQVVVFDLGTNDDPDQPGALASNLATAGKIAGKRCMVVATLNFPPVRGVGPEGLNRAVKAFAAGRSRVQVVDWRGAARPRLLAGDGTHTTTSGARVRGQLFADAAQRCIDNFAGTGPIAPEPDAAGGGGSGAGVDPSLGSGDSGTGSGAGASPPPASRSTRPRSGADGAPAAPPSPLYGFARRLAATVPGKWVLAGLATFQEGLSGAQAATGPEPVLGAE